MTIISDDLVKLQRCWIRHEVPKLILSASYRISYSVATSIYDNFIYQFTIISIHIYDSWVTIIHGDIYHNVIVNHLIRSYYNLVN